MTEDCTIKIYVDPDIVDLIPGYLTSRREDVRKLREFVDRNDLESIRMLGHNMKGSGAAYGFEEITEIGAALETAAKNGDMRRISSEVDRLSSYLERVEIADG